MVSSASIDLHSEIFSSSRISGSWTLAEELGRGRRVSCFVVCHFLTIYKFRELQHVWRGDSPDQVPQSLHYNCVHSFMFPGHHQLGMNTNRSAGNGWITTFFFRYLSSSLQPTQDYTSYFAQAFSSSTCSIPAGENIFKINEYPNQHHLLPDLQLQSLPQWLH